MDGFSCKRRLGQRRARISVHRHPGMANIIPMRSRAMRAGRRRFSSRSVSSEQDHSSRASPGPLDCARQARSVVSVRSGDDRGSLVRLRRPMFFVRLRERESSMGWSPACPTRPSPTISRSARRTVRSTARGDGQCRHRASPSCSALASRRHRFPKAGCARGDPKPAEPAAIAPRNDSPYVQAASTSAVGPYHCPDEPESGPRQSTLTRHCRVLRRPPPGPRSRHRSLRPTRPRCSRGPPGRPLAFARTQGIFCEWRRLPIMLRDRVGAVRISSLADGRPSQRPRSISPTTFFGHRTRLGTRLAEAPRHR